MRPTATSSRSPWKTASSGATVPGSFCWVTRVVPQFMRNVTLRNLDIIHFSMTPFLFEPGEDMRLENIHVEDVRIYGEGQNELIRLRPVVNQYMRKQVPGFVRNVHFEKIRLFGSPGAYQIQLAGADPEHNVRNVFSMSYDPR